MRKILKLAEIGMPPLEEVFKCVAFRAAGGDPMPRISHITGGGETAQTIPPEIEWLVPRFSCLMGLQKEEGRYGLGDTKRKITKKLSNSQSRGKMREKRVGFGVDIPVQEVQAVPVGRSEITFQAAHASRQSPKAGYRTQDRSPSQGEYIIRP